MESNDDLGQNKNQILGVINSAKDKEKKIKKMVKTIPNPENTGQVKTWFSDIIKLINKKV